MSIRSALPVLALGILASGFAPRSAIAATASALIAVSVTVQASCLATANATAVRTSRAEAVNMLSPVSVTCSNFAPYRVSLSQARTSDSNGSMLGDVLRASPRVIVTRGQTSGTQATAITGNGSAQPLGSESEQSVGDGAHADAMIVTVTY
jgi:spore coat protein U-like protein